MTLRSAAKRALQRAYLDDAARGIAQGARRLRWDAQRRFGLTDRALIARYLTENKVPKLQVGCGGHPLAGWLNSDLRPDGPTVLQLDATQRFPFADGTFDYIYSEHMIEHIDFDDGLRMLSECHRVLKPGGKLRIATPDLRFLVGLYGAELNDVQRRYLAWFRAAHLKAGAAAACHVLNNFVRNWGHRFIYDERTLRAAMAGAGFEAITGFDLHESDDEALRGLEHVERMPPDFLALETFTLQASRRAMPGP